MVGIQRFSVSGQIWLGGDGIFGHVYRNGGDVRQIGCHAWGIDDIVKSKLIDKGGHFAKERQGLRYLVSSCNHRRPFRTFSPVRYHLKPQERLIRGQRHEKQHHPTLLTSFNHDGCRSTAGGTACQLELAMSRARIVLMFLLLYGQKEGFVA